MKKLLITIISVSVLMSCGGDDEPCEQKHYVGSYLGTKEGIGCDNDDSYQFTVQAVPNAQQVIIDNHVVDFIGCVFSSDDGILKIEGTFNGSEISMVQSTISILGQGVTSCTWTGVKQE